MTIQMFAAILLALAYIPARHYACSTVMQGSLLQRCARLRALS